MNVHCKCDKCEEPSYENMEQLYNHLKRIHKIPCGYKIGQRNKTPLNCSACNFSTLSNKQFRLHKSREHTNQHSQKVTKTKTNSRRKQRNSREHPNQHSQKVRITKGKGKGQKQNKFV